MNKFSFQLGRPSSQLLLIAMLLFISYGCKETLRFPSHTLNSIFRYSAYFVPILALWPVLRLAQRPRLWGFVLLAPVILLCLLLSLMTYMGAEQMKPLQTVQQGRNTVELQTYAIGGAIGVHGLNLEQRRMIFAGVYLVRSIAFFDNAKTGALSVEGLNLVGVHTRGSYGNNDSQSYALFHVKPWVYL